MAGQREGLFSGHQAALAGENQGHPDIRPPPPDPSQRSPGGSPVPLSAAGTCWLVMLRLGWGW